MDNNFEHDSHIVVEPEMHEPREVTNVAEYVTELFSSDVFNKELQAFSLKNPIDDEALQEVKDTYQDKETRNKKLRALEIFRFLGDKNMPVIIDRFRTENNIKLKISRREITPETSDAIKTYQDQVKFNNSQNQAHIEQSELKKLDELRRQYHNDAADALFKELVSNGVIELPYEDAANIPKREFGRALVSQDTYSRLGVKNS